MDKYIQEMVDTLQRSRSISRGSKAASVTEEPMVTISIKECRLLLAQDGLCAKTIEQTIRKSKAASIGINQAQMIDEFLNSKYN